MLVENSNDIKLSPNEAPECRSVLMTRSHSGILIHESQHSPPPPPNPDFCLALRERILQVAGWKDQLMRHFTDMRENPAGPSMLLVTGTSDDDSGKSILSNSLRASVEKANGYFLTATFDHLMLPIPYEAFVTAFTQFINMVVQRGDNEVAIVRSAIRAALGDDTVVLQRMIPALDLILGAVKIDKPVSVSKGMARRFVHDFRAFINAVCSTTTSPVVLVLENLQWADKCSLDLLGTWRDHAGSLQQLMLVGTCDTTGLSSDSYLSTILRKIEDATGCPMAQVDCTELSKSELSLVVDNFLRVTDYKNVNDDICDIMYARTNGNILALDQFGRMLRDEGLVHYKRNEKTWECSNIRELDTGGAAGEGTKNSIILLQELSTLPRDQLHSLKLLTCLGLIIDPQVLKCVLDYDELLSIPYLSKSKHGVTFKDLEIRKRIYNLISEDDRKSLHLKVGRRLLQEMMDDEEQLDQYLFTILSQLHKSRPIQLDDDSERSGIGELCLRAGQKAAKLSTFRTACLYLEFGIECLGEQCWEEHYPLSLTIHNALAEMYLCTSSYDKMDVIRDVVLRNARSPLDKLHAYSTRVYYLGVVGQHREAFQVGLEALNLLGESFPTRAIKFHMMKDFATVSKILSRKSNEQLLRLPVTTDDNKLASMRILQLMMIFALQAGHSSEWYSLIVIKLMKMTLQHGMSVFAPIAFAAYGLIEVHVHKDWAKGYRCGELSLSLLEKYGTVEYLPRVFKLVYNHLFPLKNHVRRCIEPLRFASQIGLQTGDFETMGLCAAASTFAMFEASIPLGTVARHFDEYKETLLANDQKATLGFILPVMEAVYRYMGRSPDPISGRGVLFDFDDALKAATEKGQRHIRAVILVVRSKIAYYFNDYEAAYQFLATESEIKSLNAANVCLQNSFARGLILIAAARSLGKRQIGLHRYLKRTSKKLHKYGQFCPENLLDKAYLLEAETASLAGRNLLAVNKYKRAISAAAASKLHFFHGVANELAARHFVRLGQLEEARKFFDDACTSFDTWGGHAKLLRLKADIESIYGKVAKEQHVTSAIRVELRP